MIHFASYLTTKIVVGNQTVGHTNKDIMVWIECGGNILQNIVSPTKHCYGSE